MFGRKNRKRQGSVGSIDLLTATPAPAPPTPDQQPATTPPPSASQQPKEKAYQYLLGRVGFGQRERTRTTSDDGSLHGSSSSATNKSDATATSSTSSSGGGSGGGFGGKLFGKSTSNLNSLPFSASMQDVSTIPGRNGAAAPSNSSTGPGTGTASSSGGGFFRRQPTTSTASRPGWLSRGTGGGDKDRPNTPSPLTPSPSSPTLSSQATSGGEGTAARRREGSNKREERVYVYSESGRQLAALGGTNATELGRLTPNQNQHQFSRSAEDLSRLPNPTATASLKNLPPRQTSLSPSTAALPTSSRSPSPAPSTSVPFPTSASTPNLYSAQTLTRNSPLLNGSPTILENGTNGDDRSEGERRRDSQTIYCQGFLLRKGDYPSSSPALSSPSIHHSSNHSTPTFFLPSPTPDSNPAATTRHHASPSLLFLSSTGNVSPKPLPSPSLPTTSPNPNSIDLSKGLKPYRAILKGSKLYLHKVPGDLLPVCKTLFPLGVESTGIAVSPQEGTGSWGVAGAEKRRKRTFWGTGEKGVGHPELVLSEIGKKKVVAGGTMEALVHEMVFGTSFRDTEIDAEKEATGRSTDDSEPTEDYRKYLTTLLLHLPFLPLPIPATASELDRCATLAVRTALESPIKLAPTPLTKRLQLILKMIIDDYSEDLGDQTEEAKAWTAAINEVVALTATLPDADGRFESEFKDVIEKNKEVKRRAVTEWESPSPRPPYSRSGSSSSTSTSGSPTKTRKRLPTEAEIGPALTTQAFLAQDPATFAKNIHLFHLDRLAALTGRYSTPRLILRAAMVLLTESTPKSTTLATLFSFSPNNPHPISRIVINTILPSNSQAVTPIHTPATLFFGPSSTVIESRALVLSRWITVGEELRKQGDAAGWVAVATALCSRAVARLDETWRLVEEEVIAVVRNEWAPMLSSLGWIDGEDASVGPMVFEAKEKDCEVPYLGSVLEEAVVALKTAQTTASEKGAGVLDLLPLYGIREKLDKVDEMWSQGPPATLTDTPADVSLQVIFQHYSRLPTPAKSSLSAYLPQSLELEVRMTTQHLNVPQKPRTANDPSPLLPVLMVEPLPYITLVDREKIIQSAVGAMPRKQSVSNLSITHQPSTPNLKAAARLARHNSYPPSTATSTADRTSIFTLLRKEIETPSDTLLRFADGDIVFRILSAALPAVPAALSNDKGMLSRTSSWVESRSSRATTRGLRSSATSSRALSPLVRTESHSSSLASPRNSLLSESLHVPSKLQVAGEQEPVYVVVKSGTVESLVDLLVMGVDNLKTPSTDADGESSLTGRRPLALDMDEFRAAFFATFRSFTTPLVVLDLLRKRYLAAPSASTEYVSLSSTKPFPSWSLRPTGDAELDLSIIAKVRLAIVEHLRYWVDNHVLDFLDDDNLFTAASAFLSFVVVTETAAVVEHPETADRVLATATALRKRFGKNTLRPPVQSRKAAVSPESKEEAVSLSFDQMSSATLVEHLDRIAVAVSGDVTESDLLRYIDVLEASVRTDPCAWYSTRLLSKSDDDDLVIADPYFQLQAVAAESNLHKRLPLALQHCVQTQGTIRRWIMCHLVDPDLTLDQRKARMTKALEMVEVCRSRMSNVFFGGQPEPLSQITDPSLASFVERATLSAIVSPESRLFGSAWLAVSTSRGVPLPDSVAAIISSNLVMTDATATLDLAWLNERLVEIVTQVESLSEGASINFAKRRWIFNCIRNALAITPSQTVSGTPALAQMEQRLNGWGNWGFRILRDVASGEGNKHTKSTKPFHRLVAQQQDKIRRDRQTRDFVAKGVKLEQQGRIQREKEVAKAMEKSVTVRARRMTSIFRVVRPATSPAGLPPSPLSPSPESLQALRNWTPASKPFLVLALSNVNVQPYDNLQRPFVFELTTEDGGRSLFQAPTRDEMEMWITNFRRSGTQIAFRRATFLAETPLAEEPDDYLNAKAIAVAPPIVASKGVFNVPLWDLLKQEGSTIPNFIECALEVIEARGLSEVGIYRISGESRVITEMKDALNRGADPSRLIQDTDVHNITGLVKLFLRELPEPVLPFDFYHPFIAANAIEDYDERLYAIRDLVWKMPQSSFHLLRRFTEHLDEITDNEGVNAMHAANLSIIFAPTLLKPAPSPATFGISMANLGKAANIVKSLILQQNWIFGEEVAEEEAEVEPTPSEVQEVLVDEAFVGVGLGVSSAANGDASDAAAEPSSDPEPASDKDTDEAVVTADEGSVDSHSTKLSMESERAVVDYRPSIELGTATPQLPELAWPTSNVDDTSTSPKQADNKPKPLSTTPSFSALTLPALPSPISDSFANFADSIAKIGTDP